MSMQQRRAQWAYDFLLDTRPGICGSRDVTDLNGVKLRNLIPGRHVNDCSAGDHGVWNLRSMQIENLDNCRFQTVTLDPGKLPSFVSAKHCANPFGFYSVVKGLV